jgi:hypothetical protein
MKRWQPLLTGELAERARRVVEEIAAVLDPGSASPSHADPREAQEPVERPPSPSGTSPGTPAAAQEPPEAPQLAAVDAILANPNLAGGAAGAALFFAYRAAASAAGGGDSAAAAIFLDRSTEALATTPLAPDLYGGFSGVAWTAEHLYGPRFAELDGGLDADAAASEPRTAAAPETADDGAGSPEGAAGDVEDPLAEIDDALLRYVDRTPWTADYDLIRGLAGLGVYALERLPRPGALLCLAKIVDRLSETAEHGPQGTTWHTAPELLPDWQREIYPTGYYNLGLAHGVPAVIALLSVTSTVAARMGAAGDAAAAELARRARPLADGALRWLLAQRLPSGMSSWFGATFSPENPAQQSRLAWCYGDPGIAASLLVTARAAGDAALERFAVDLALDTAARPTESSAVRDAGLCHGSAGLAHLFNRFYQETGEPRLAEASRRWFERALDFQLPGQGFAGYRAYWVEPESNVESWRNEAGLLEGVAGIGLALLGGIGDFEPAWDRVLMLSAAQPPPADQPPRT